MTLLWTLVVLSAAWAAYAYVGYPMVLWVLARLSPLPAPTTLGNDEADRNPFISIIVAAYNADLELAGKLEDTLALHYEGPLEIIVSSDGSSDGTLDIARSFADRGVILVHDDERAGKETAQARGIAVARGDILVFTDVSSRLDIEALRYIVRPFADASVGCVSSEDVVDLEGGEGAYVRYEMALRRLESQATSLIGLSGSFFATRRELAEVWPGDLASDFRTALEAGRRGLRAVSEPRSQARFETLSDPAREWTRKVRTVQRGLAVLSHHRELLHPRHGRLAFSLWGHKVARFATPFALLILLLACTLGAVSDPGLRLLLFGQLAFYLGGVLALTTETAARYLPLRVAGFFILVNASIMVAWFHHLTGPKAVLWAPTER